MLIICNVKMKSILHEIFRQRFLNQPAFNFKRFYQTNVNKTKISSPEFQSVLTDELLKLKNIFEKYNYELRIAGGAVRDLLTGKKPVDVDLATTATPTQMIEMFKREDVRIINEYGISHGTVPVRIDDKQNFEVTTLRIDKKTDGRHAKVEFTNDWYIDANRRDLTVNSMFLDFDGTVTDYFNGIIDLKNKKIRFVGEPDKRIKEDYLRILRYFRFFGRIADDSSKLYDEETFQAIKINSKGLAGISPERKWYELKKIFVQNYAGLVIRAFYDTNIAVHLGLPADANFKELDRVIAVTEKQNPKVMTIASSLMKNHDDLNIFNQHLKIANTEKHLGFAIILYRDMLKINSNEEDKLSFYKQAMGYPRGNVDKPLKLEEIIEILKYQGNSMYINDSLNNFQVPSFLLTFNEIKEGLDSDIKENRFIIKLATEKLRSKWIKSNYKISKKELLAYMSDKSFLTEIKHEYEKLLAQQKTKKIKK